MLRALLLSVYLEAFVASLDHERPSPPSNTDLEPDVAGRPRAKSPYNVTMFHESIGHM